MTMKTPEEIALAVTPDHALWPRDTDALRSYIAAGIAVDREQHAAPTPASDPTVDRVIESARRFEPWFTERADAVLARIKTESTEDVMLYHDAVSVLVGARDLLRVISALPTSPSYTPPTERTAE